MERLTRRMCGGWGVVPGYELNTARGAKAVVDRLVAYEDIGLMPDEIDSVFINSVMEENKRLKELSQAEKDGRLVVLPCKIWDLYFTIERFCDENGELPEFTLHSASDCEWCCVPCNKRLDIIEHRFSNAKHILSLNDSIGKSVFLTREEAEAALKKRGGRQ